MGYEALTDIAVLILAQFISYYIYCNFCFKVVFKPIILMVGVT